MTLKDLVRNTIRFNRCVGILAVGSMLALPLLSQTVVNDFAVVTQAGPAGDRGLALEFSVKETGQFVVFALGPSAKLPNAVSDPRLTLESSDGTVIDSVDNWADHPTESAVIKAFDAFGVWLQASEAAMVVRLLPGTYKVKVSNKGFIWGTVRAGVSRWEDSAGPDVGGNVPPTGIAPGLYRGSGAGFFGCLYVSSDSTRLTSRGSRCFQDDDQNDNDDPESFDVEYDNVLTGPCGDDDGNLNWDFDVPINNGQFSIVNNFASFWASINLKAEGTFSADGRSVSGTFIKTLGGRTCTASFTMTHVGN